LLGNELGERLSVPLAMGRQLGVTSDQVALIEDRLAVPREIHRARASVQVHHERHDLRRQISADTSDFKPRSAFPHFYVSSLARLDRLVMLFVMLDALFELVDSDEVRRRLHRLDVLSNCDVVADALQPQHAEAVFLRHAVLDPGASLHRAEGAVHDRDLAASVQVPHHVLQRLRQELIAQRDVRLVRKVKEIRLLSADSALSVLGQREHFRAVVDPPQVPRHFARDVRLASTRQPHRHNEQLAASSMSGVQQIRLF
jgi:hypothetical protein